MIKKVIIIFFILLIIVVTVVTFIKPKAPIKMLPSPTPYTLDTVNAWNDIAPGVSSLQEVTSRLGSPVSSHNTEAGMVYQYPSKNQYWNNEVTITNNVVSFIVERIFSPDETSLKKLTENLSEEPTRLYGPDFEGGTYLFAYPASGIGYIANESQDTVYQVWHFPSTTLLNLLQLLQLKDYGLQPRGELEGI